MKKKRIKNAKSKKTKKLRRPIRPRRPRKFKRNLSRKTQTIRIQTIEKLPISKEEAEGLLEKLKNGIIDKLIVKSNGEVKYEFEKEGNVIKDKKS
jgi:hypothetical protein